MHHKDIKHQVRKQLKKTLSQLGLLSKKWTHRTAKLYEATGGVPPWENVSTKNLKLKQYD